MPRMQIRIIDSPVGKLRLVAEDGFLTELRFGGEPAVVDGDMEESAVLDETERQLGEYFRGERKEFDLPLRMKGTPFQLEDWEALKGIPYGETITYGEIARRIGRPKASRAVGMANHNNPISIIVPCHRVIGQNGKLTGYGGGLDVKRQLLELEQKWVENGEV